MFKKVLLFISLLTLQLNANSKPNVLFIIADDLNTMLGCYGDKVSQTPVLDKLAKQGVHFEKCYTQFPTCGPSRLSMLSGLYPYQNGVISNYKKFDYQNASFKTLPALFKENGYTTARVGKAFHMGIPRGIGKAGPDDTAAWDHAINNTGWDAERDNYSKAKKFGTYKNPGVAISYHAPEIAANQMADGTGTDAAINLMDKVNPEKTGKPFLMFMGYYRPHPPMIAPKSNWDKIDPSLINIPKSNPELRKRIPTVNFHLTTKDFNFIPEDIGRNYTHAYYAAINFVDSEVGRLITALKQKGLDKNTIIIFTSDQGFHLGEHGHWHKSTFFEEACGTFQSGG